MMFRVLLVVLVVVSMQVMPSEAAPRAPTSVDIKPPKKLAKVVVPKDVPATPPAQDWWTQENACPAGTRYDESEAYGRRTHRCLDEGGRPHGPLTLVGKDGKLEGDAWYRHGKRHGLERIMVPGRANQSYTYVDDEKHGPANEYGDLGDYYRGRKHGLWKVQRGGSSPQRGYFVDDEREGTWLAVGCEVKTPCVIARATYRRGQPTGTVSWWTEDGDPLASGRTSAGSTTWQLGTGRKWQVTLTCRDHRASYLRVAKKGEAVTCTYDADGGLARQTGGERGLGCPGDGAHRICEGDILDPYHAASAMNRIWQ